MLGVALRTNRRLRGKTPPPPQRQQTSLPAPLALEAEAPTDGKRQAYLVTLPCPRPGSVSSTGQPLVAPGSKTKAEVLACFLDACAHPDYANAWQGGHSRVELDKAGLWREFHEERQQRDEHDHIAALAQKGHDFRYLPVKRALLLRHGIASHWSCTHTGYWSCVRYCAMASPKKPDGAIDKAPELWSRQGAHPPVIDCCYAPVTERALTAKRQKMASAAAAAGKGEPKVNDLDVWALVVRSGVRNSEDDQTAHLQLAAYAKEHCGEAMVQYLFRRRHVLRKMIDDIWEWENVEQALAVARRTRLDALTAAEQAPCVCQGEWTAFVRSSLWQNGIRASELCYDILDALTRGRSETTPVIVLGGRQGGEGKSCFLKPLHSVYYGQDQVFATPESGNFPLMNLPGSKVAFLDDYRFNPDVVSWGTTQLWFDGSHVPIGQPQHVAGHSGNIKYKGTAPIFITCKLSDLEWLEWYAAINPDTGNPWDSEASMIMRRLKVYRFTQKVPKPRSQIPFCAHCFANFFKGTSSNVGAAGAELNSGRSSQGALRQGKRRRKGTVHGH